MEHVTVSRSSAIVRDAIGLLWMVTAGSIAALGAVAMVSVTVQQAVVLLVVVGVVCALLFFMGIRVLRAAVRLPREASPEIVATRKNFSRRFGLVVALETFALLAANIVLLWINHYEYLVPIVLLIVGVHFFPVAILFKMWPYHFTAAIFSLAAIAPLVSMPVTTTIGHVSSWIVLPTAGGAIGAWLTAGCLLGIERKRLGWGKSSS